MAVQIPFPLPSHGFAQNSKMRVNLDFLVNTFNEFNTGTATWDTVGIGIANNETGTLTFYNSSNANYLTFKAGATSPSATYTLPIALPSAVGYNSILQSTNSGIMSWTSDPILHNIRAGIVITESYYQWFDIPTGKSTTIGIQSNPSLNLDFKLPNTLGNNGDILTVNGSGVMSWSPVGSAIALSSLSDVTIASPATSQILTYNGTKWVNGNPVPASAGNGVEFFMNASTIIGTGTNNANELNTLTRAPSGAIEDLVSGNCTNNTILVEAHLYNTQLNRTVFDAGVWDFDTWAYVNSTVGGRVSSMSINVCRVRPEQGGHTVTTTGTGTSRTATSSAGTPFNTTDCTASATNTTASYLQTPQGLYQITARTSDTIVTISTPSTYVNESSVAFSVWKQLFSCSTGTITTTSVALYNSQTVQPSFSCVATDKIGQLDFATSNNTTTVTHAQDGTAHYSHFASPLSTLHNDLAGLQGGTTNEYYHLTSAEHSIVSSGTFSIPITITPVSNQIVLGTTNTVTLNGVAPISSRIYSFPDAGTNADIVLTQGTQSIDGSKSFINAVSFANGSNTTPSINLGDSGSGLYRSALNEVAVTINTGQTARFSASNFNVATNVTLAAGKTLNLNGATSGTLILKTPDTTTTYTLTLPPNAGTVDYVLRTDGSGTTSWVNLSSVGGANNTLSNLSDTVAINKNLNNFTAGTITASLTGHASLDLHLSAGAGDELSGDLYTAHNIIFHAALGGYKQIAGVNNAVSYTLTLPPTVGQTGQPLIDSDGSGTLTFGNDLQLGKTTGTAGSLTIWGSSSTGGKTVLNHTVSAGNYTTTITNASQAASRTYTIPDAGTNSDFVFNNGDYTIGGTWTFSKNLTVSNPIIGGTALLTLFNTDSTNTGSNAYIVADTVSTGGDPAIGLYVNGVTSWTIGADNSDSDKLKIQPSTTVGSSTVLTIDTAGAVTLVNDVTLQTSGNPRLRILDTGTGTAGIFLASHNNAGGSTIRDSNKTLEFYTSTKGLVLSFNDVSGLATFSGGVNCTLVGSNTMTGTFTLGSTGYFIGEATNGIRFNNAADTINLVIMKDTGVQVLGTTTNNNAPAGYIGEYVENTVSTQNVGTSGQYSDVTSITLTAGDWDITLVASAQANGATVTGMDFGIGTASGNSSTGAVLGVNYVQCPTASGIIRFNACVGSYRVSISGSTTYYLKILPTYTVATPQVWARLSARRVR